MSLPSSMADFVPRDRQLQKAYHSRLSSCPCDGSNSVLYLFMFLQLVENDDEEPAVKLCEFSCNFSRFTRASFAATLHGKLRNKVAKQDSAFQTFETSTSVQSPFGSQLNFVKLARFLQMGKFLRSFSASFHLGFGRCLVYRKQNCLLKRYANQV